MGQFTADVDRVGQIDVAPTRTLEPTSQLFRAATEEYADSIACTTEEDATKMHEIWRGPTARLWAAEAEHVYGRVYWESSEMVAPYWEWLIEPENVRPWDGSSSSSEYSGDGVDARLGRAGAAPSAG